MLADVIEIPGKGRGLVASRDILAGEMILEEAATFLIVEEDHLSTACSMCLNTVEPGKQRTFFLSVICSEPKSLYKRGRQFLNT